MIYLVKTLILGIYFLTLPIYLLFEFYQPQEISIIIVVGLFFIFFLFFFWLINFTSIINKFSFLILGFIFGAFPFILLLNPNPPFSFIDPNDIVNLITWFGVFFGLLIYNKNRESNFVSKQLNAFNKLYFWHLGFFSIIIMSIIFDMIWGNCSSGCFMYTSVLIGVPLLIIGFFIGSVVYIRHNKSFTIIESISQILLFDIIYIGIPLLSFFLFWPGNF